jgi:lipocalin
VSSEPIAAPDFDAQRFLGTWFIVVTNYGYWRSRHDPTVTYEPMPSDGARTWRDTLRFSSRGMFGGARKPGTLGGVDRERSPGRWIWRGDGLLAIIKSPWWVMLVDPDDEWAVTYFGRSNVGTAPGMDIYGRKPDMPREQIATILERCRAHPFLAQHCHRLYATVQGALPTDRYDLD